MSGKLFALFKRLAAVEAISKDMGDVMEEFVDNLGADITCASSTSLHWQRESASGSTKEQPPRD